MGVDARYSLNSGLGTAEIHILGNAQKSCCSQRTEFLSPTFPLIPRPCLRAPRLGQVSATP